MKPNKWKIRDGAGNTLYAGETMDGITRRATMRGAILQGWNKWLPSSIGSQLGVGTIRNTGWMKMSLVTFKKLSAE